MNNKIIFFYRDGRIKKLHNKNLESREFFFGYDYLKKKNYDLKIIEDNSIGISNFHFIFRIINRLFLFTKLPIGTMISFLFHFQKVDKNRILILTTNTQGIIFSIAKSLNLINNEIYFVIMGAVSVKISKLKQLFFNYIFKNINLIVQSKPELYFLETKLPKIRKFFVPFGVNDEFWNSSNKVKNTNHDRFVLSIGNDLSRDYNTLISSWKDNFPRLIIITSLPIKSNKKNIDIIKGDWKKYILTDFQIKEYYQKCLFVVLPIKNVIDASGQSVCLQAMACKKSVIISKTIGFWDDEYFENYKNILFCNHSDPKDLSIKVNELLFDNNLNYNIAKNAQILIKKKFSYEIMSKEFEKVMLNNYENSHKF